jgi:PAS domain S-box-containing protein
VTEVEDLRARLAEAEEVLRAIRNGEVDAVVVTGEGGDQVYPLQGTGDVFRQLIETLSEGAATLSADGTILYCNACLAQILGRPLDQVIGASLLEFLLGEDRQALEAILAQARTRPCRREICLQSSEGTPFPVYLAASRLRGESAEGTFCVVLTDLTEHKRNEQVVADERLARSILDQAAEVIVVCNEQGVIIRASEAAVRFCDGSPLLRPFAEVFPLLADGSNPFDLAPVLKGGTLRCVDVFLDRQGQKLDLILNAGPLVNGPQILGGVITLTDITARKLAEEEQQRVSAELRQKNAELERFHYTASHDLRSPAVTFRTFLGFLERDLESGDAARIRSDLAHLDAAAEKMVQRLDDLLHLSRLGRAEAPHSRFTLHELAGEAVETLAGVIVERGVRVELVGPDPSLSGDRRRLSEIWQNLVENAVKFMGNQPEPCVQIGAEPEGAETLFYVRDNGIGIEPRFLGRIFDVFDKLDACSEGSGIGLAVVKRIVESNGGRIRVESAGPGQGACFRFTLPGVLVPREVDAG